MQGAGHRQLRLMKNLRDTKAEGMVQWDMASLNPFATFNVPFLSATFNEENDFYGIGFQGGIEGPEIMG